MSDAVTTTEIDDVLVSIRRLVAQEPRPAGTAAPEDTKAGDAKAGDAKAGDAKAGRLILTPALRVVSDEAEAGEGRPAAASEDRGTLERTIAELEAAIAVYTDEWEPDGGDALPPAEAKAPPSALGRMAMAEVPEVAAGPEGVAEVEAEVSPAAGPEPDAAGADAMPGASGAGAGDLLAADAGLPGAEEVPAEEPAAPQRMAGGNVHSFGAVANWRTEPAPVSPPMAAGENALPPDATGEAGEAEAVLDEAALRDLVAQIVREELRGELGERITRNVRKFVRAEIARALSGSGG